MSITSFGFLLMICAGVSLYYILPKSWQWVELLVLSLIFYCMSAAPYTFVYILISTAAAYISTRFARGKGAETDRGRKLAACLGVGAVLINVGLWFVFKGKGLWMPFFGEAAVMPYLAALGMGYYTLQVIGYILDCYWGSIEPQKNPLKLLLFVCFFPQMITGPISRYSQLEALYEKHPLSYENITFGAQRILWGFFKKLVLAERVGAVVNAIWEMQTQEAVFLWIALLLYPIQMYADFSGCMDIVIGAAECFGIKLPENFNNPFFARSIQEFWQRWHITLGTWAKDYVLYPLLKSERMVRLGSSAKKKFGKRYGKFISTALGMLVLWLVMGIWHGGVKYILGVSLWYWALLMLGDLCAPGLKKVTRLLKVHEDSFSWRLLQSIRTYLIYAVGAVFFRAETVGGALAFFKNMLVMTVNGNLHLENLFNKSLLQLGLNISDWIVILISVLLLVTAAVLREKDGYARAWVARQILPFRWFVWLGFLVAVVICGKYGEQYNAVNFIYQIF